ncbi:MAG: DUF4214 domain-containing protein [Pyrinomonadaceae bacterium]
MLKFIFTVLTIALIAASALGQAPTLRIVTDDPTLPSDLFYGNIKVKPLRLRPGTNSVITIDDSDFFVSQHYVDFLNRFPDQGGMDYWTAQLANCGSNAACLNDHRINVSAAFFIELEFQQTGSYVYRFYKGSLGRQPAYNEFTPDRRQVVGGANLEASKAAFAESWTQRAEFQSRYGSLSNNAFVDALIATVKQADGVDLSSMSASLKAQLGGGATRGQITRQVIDAQAFANAEYNPSFVRMQYFGYLKRDPDAGGEAFWLNVLNNAEPNNFRGMVCSFITSREYQERFGSSVTHTNADCANVH